MTRRWSVTLIFAVIELLGVGGLGAWAANRIYPEIADSLLVCPIRRLHESWSQPVTAQAP